MKAPNWFAYCDIAAIVLNTIAFVFGFALRNNFMMILHGVFVTVSIQHLLNNFVWNRDEKEV